MFGPEDVLFAQCSDCKRKEMIPSPCVAHIVAAEEALDEEWFLSLGNNASTESAWGGAHLEGVVVFLFTRRE